MTFPLARLLAAAAVLSAPSIFGAEWKTHAIPESAPPPANTPARWLRCHVKVPENMAYGGKRDLWRDSLTLTLRKTGGKFTVRINGRTVAEGSGPETRRYKLAPETFEAGKWNTVVVELQGAMEAAPILAGYFDEGVLAGPWQVTASAPGEAELAALPAAPPAAAFAETAFRPASTPLAADGVAMPGMRMSPADQLARMVPGDGLAVDLVAADPDIAQPTHISFDERGRMWVSQYRQYPYPAGIKQISRDKYYRAVFDKVPPAPPHYD